LEVLGKTLKTWPG